MTETKAGRAQDGLIEFLRPMIRADAADPDAYEKAVRGQLDAIEREAHEQGVAHGGRQERERIRAFTKHVYPAMTHGELLHVLAEIVAILAEPSE